MLSARPASLTPNAVLSQIGAQARALRELRTALAYQALMQRRFAR